MFFRIKKLVLVLFIIWNLVILFHIYNRKASNKRKIQIITPSVKVISKCSYHLPNLSNISDYSQKIDFTPYKNFSGVSSKIKSLSINLLQGGFYSTVINKNCYSKNRIAFLIPYRDRLDNLLFFLSNIHPILSQQNITYGVYLIEPQTGLTFNRGLLFNIGFNEVIRDKSESSQNGSFWNCFIFHDVDMIPEDKRLLYTCDQKNPLHLAVAIRKFEYKHDGYYSFYYGGIIALSYEQYKNLNGFSNIYFGWGAEDDDLGRRIRHKYQKVIKVDHQIGRIYTDSHQAERPNPNRVDLFGKGNLFINGSDILEGLSTVKYTLNSIERHPLFTKIIVNYNQTEVINNANECLKMLKHNVTIA